MANSNIEQYEHSQQDGLPIECYKFTNGDTSFLYTSHCEDVNIVITENGATRTETYFADYVERDTLKPCSKDDSPSLVVSVSKDSPVGMLYQGPPPEIPLKMALKKIHKQDNTLVDVIFWGVVSQANFEDSVCKLTIKQENWLSKELPKGKKKYFCNNVIYDEDCKLNEDDYKVNFIIDYASGTTIRSTTFALYADGYFNGGLMRHGNNVRMVDAHVGDTISLRYPFSDTPRNEAVISPGCDHLFSTCVAKYNNSLNFTGCPYVPPTDPTRNPTGGGVYWVDSQVVQRDTDGFVGTISL